MGVQKYVEFIRHSGFNAPCLENPVRMHKQSCKLCPLVSYVYGKEDPMKRLVQRFYRVPDQFVPSVINKNPLQVMQLDELGPMCLVNDNGEVKIWILLCVEVVT